MSNTNDNNTENDSVSPNLNPNDNSINENKYYIEDYSMNVTYEEFDTCNILIV